MSPAMMAGTGIVRGVVAGVLLVAFIALWISVYSARRRTGFEVAARLPLEDDVYLGAAPCCRGAAVPVVDVARGAPK